MNAREARKRLSECVLHLQHMPNSRNVTYIDLAVSALACAVESLLPAEPAADAPLLESDDPRWQAGFKVGREAERAVVVQHLLKMRKHYDEIVLGLVAQEIMDGGHLNTPSPAGTPSPPDAPPSGYQWSSDEERARGSQQGP